MSQRLPDASEESLNIVRRRIMAITWVVTSIHGLFGAIGAAYALGADRRSDQIILLVVSVPLALIIYGVTVVILDKPPISWRTTPWLVLLLSFCVAGFVWVL
ncbi:MULTISPECIES: hypothetical protein [Aeromicrobium]|uniref:hypothetical protein n=1 Tax=Aeromicrobium TaxID=2040 RepID=UPI00257A4664|nr:MULTISPECIES: hypothetical protein [Aeromicrobium]